MKEDIFEKRKKVIYDLICDEHYVPMKVKELAILLQVTKEERPSLQAVLDELVKEGKIEVSKRGKYKKLESPVLVGTFIGNQKGFGFVEIEGAEEDIFIPEAGVNGALHQDTVQVALVSVKPGKRREGEVRKVKTLGL